MGLTIFDATRKTTRSCGGCTECCRLLPVVELDKAADTRCRHQRIGKGCAVYHKPGMPMSCHLWTCRWLLDGDADFSRPDRSHAVVDCVPDYVVSVAPGQPPQRIPVIVVWVNPRYPHAHRDPALRAYLARRGEEGYATQVRYDSARGFTLIPPAMSSTGQWHETPENIAAGPAHSTTGELWDMFAPAITLAADHAWPKKTGANAPA